MEVFTGTILPFAFDFAPRGWLSCQGQVLSTEQYSQLFAVIGTTYGGDGKTTFQLPDLRGQSLVGTGAGIGLAPVEQGQLLGQEKVTLVIDQMPSHVHTATAASKLYAVDVPGTANNPAGKMIGGIQNGFIDPNPTQNKELYKESVQTTVTLERAGGNDPLPIRNPCLGMNYCICVYGLFPPRD